MFHGHLFEFFVTPFSLAAKMWALTDLLLTNAGENNNSADLTHKRTMMEHSSHPPLANCTWLLLWMTDWLWFFLFFFLPQKDLGGREDEQKEGDEEIETKTSTCHRGAINGLINSYPLPGIPQCSSVQSCVCALHYLCNLFLDKMIQEFSRQFLVSLSLHKVY